MTAITKQYVKERLKQLANWFRRQRYNAGKAVRIVDDLTKSYQNIHTLIINELWRKKDECFQTSNTVVEYNPTSPAPLPASERRHARSASNTIQAKRSVVTERSVV